jgi:F0F1-type ATP synthase beta subunit
MRNYQKIYDSLEITKKDGTKLILEIACGEDTVRTISMDSTDGFAVGLMYYLQETNSNAYRTRCLRTFVW